MEGAWKGAVTGAISGATSYLGVPGIIPSGLLQSGASVGINGITNTLGGDNFFENWGVAAISGFAGGAYSGYSVANAEGLNYWWGNSVGNKRTNWSIFNWDLPDQVIKFDIPKIPGDGQICVPLTGAEMESIRGGERSVDDFIQHFGTDVNRGTSISEKNLLSKFEKLGFPNYELTYQEMVNSDITNLYKLNNNVLVTHYPTQGVMHISPIKSIKYFPQGKVIIKPHRGNSFNLIDYLSNYGKNVSFYNFFY